MGNRDKPFFDQWSAMGAIHTPKQNRLLSALPQADYERLEPHLELVALPLGCVLYTAGAAQSYAYFPTTSVVALLCGTESGDVTEITGCGNEGVMGLELILGNGATSNHGVVRHGGYGYRIRAALLKAAFDRQGPLRPLLLLYMQLLMTQMAQAAVCNGLHTVDQRVCRWLLATTDRLSSNNLPITHELLAQMLGVRREGVTEAASRLQRAGIIARRRGHIMVLERHKLEERSCPCYAVVKKESERLFPVPQTHRDWQFRQRIAPPLVAATPFNKTRMANACPVA